VCRRGFRRQDEKKKKTNHPNGVKSKKRAQIKECKLSRGVKTKRLKTGSGVLGLGESNVNADRCNSGNDCSCSIKYLSC